MNKKLIALVPGDGSGPDMMRVACAVAYRAALKDDIYLEFEKTPMGWSAYHEFGDTRPEEMLRRAIEIGTIFFGGVGDTKFDKTIGVEFPHMKPEARCLLKLRKDMGLLLNFRPMIYYKELAHLAGVRPERIPENGISQVWIRYLLEDTYFGTEDFIKELPLRCKHILGLKIKADVTGDEDLVSDIGYYRKSTVEKYLRFAFEYARQAGLPLISIDKANVSSRYQFWRIISKRIGESEFPDVQLKHQLVDSANALLFTPAALHGVIACGNEHGDILSDGAAGALGSMGLMCSSAINPDTGAAMFESGAGTAPELAGKNIANPIGRILTAALMLRHIGAVQGAESIELAVKRVLVEGYRTADLAQETDPKEMVLGTAEIGNLILSYL